jgi:hypothetical protein
MPGLESFLTKVQADFRLIRYQRLKMVERCGMSWYVIVKVGWIKIGERVRETP